MPSAAADSTSRYAYGWCVSDSEARLIGIGISTSPESLASLGPPLARDTTFSEDDGGRFASERLSFSRITISIDTRGWGINLIETTHPSVVLAGTVHTDMPLDAALDSLRVPVSRRARAEWSTAPMWEGELCEKGRFPLVPSELGTLRLYVGPDARIVRIALTNFGP